MLTTGTRVFSGLALVGLVGGFLTGFSTCFPVEFAGELPPVRCEGSQGLIDSILGPITFGWQGAVGDHVQYSFFASMAVVSGLLAVVFAAWRDADPEAAAELLHAETAPISNPPPSLSWWPLLGAASAATVAVGVVAGQVFVMLGLAGVVVVTFEWMLRAWAEHATRDPRVNEEVRFRIASWLEIPGLALVAVGAFAFAFSRVLLAVSRTEAVAIAGGVAFLGLVGFSLAAYVPGVPKAFWKAVAVIGAILLLGAGVISAAVGEREFEHRESETGAGPGVVEVFPVPQHTKRI